MFKILAEQFSTDYCDLENDEVLENISTKEILEKLDSNRFLKNKSVPLYDSETEIVIASCNPLNKDVYDWVRFEASKDVSIVLADEVKILQLLQKYSKDFRVDHLSVEDNESSSDGLESSGEGKVGKIDLERNNLSEQIRNSSPAMKHCDEILAAGVLKDASDIHIEPKNDRLQVRLRIDGNMEDLDSINIEYKSAIISRIKLLAGMDIAEKRRPQDGKLRIGIAKEKYDMRVSTIPTPFGEKIVLRILKANFSFLTFPQLGFPDDIEMSISEILMSTGKILLVTGPTGSGKTTSLYTCLKFCQGGNENIQTVEDPIEQTIPGINQIQVNAEIGVTFVSALRSILRQDPDVIMLGEIRDNETAKIAIQASDTGHLVLSTLHTNSAPSAVGRLLNLGINPALLGSNLAGVLAQRLVRTICPKCKEAAPDSVKTRYAKVLKNTGIDTDKITLYHGKGCSHCAKTGYKGRAGIYSFLKVNDAVSKLIHANATMHEIIAEAKKNGFHELHEAAGHLVRDGVTTIEEVMPYLIDQESEAAEPLPENIDHQPKTVAISQNEVQKIRAKVAAEQDLPNAVIAKPKVLVIDDSEDARMLLTTMLRSNLYEVEEARNGQEGIQKAYSFKPDLILCDYEMPVMNGREFLLNMKNDKAIKDIPVVVLTAVDTEDNETDFIEIGASDFISKDSSYKLMISRIRRFLR